MSGDREHFQQGNGNRGEASKWGGLILKPWANFEGQMIEQQKRMRDEFGPCEKDQLWRWFIDRNKRNI